MFDSPIVYDLTINFLFQIHEIFISEIFI